MSDGSLIVITDPGGTSEEARSLYAWIVEHGPGNESLAAIDMMAMVAVKYQVALKLGPFAQQIATAAGKTLKLVRYDAVQTLDVCAP